MHTYMYIHLERVLQLFKSGHEVGNPTVQAPANQYLPLLPSSMPRQEVGLGFRAYGLNRASCIRQSESFHITVAS